MKRVIRFSRYRFVMIGLSTVIIVTGVVLFATRGLNLGVDFRGGLSQQIQIAPIAMTLSASAEAKVEVSSYSEEREILGEAALSFTVTKGAESQSYRFVFGDYGTIGDLAEACRTVPGVSAAVVGDAALPPTRLFPVDFPVDISQTSLAVNYALAQGDRTFADIEGVRAALAELGEFEVQTLGGAEDQQFLLKMGVPEGDNLEFRREIEEKVKGLLGGVFEPGQVIIRKTDYVGPSLAGELAVQTVSVIGVALVLMLIYLTLRFRFESALACVLCVVHDSAVMVTVALALGIEFSTSVVAAILTIIGYSVNDTIVIFDRVREDMGLMRDADERLIFDTALSQTLGRTLITSFVTLLAVVAMYVFTTGPLKDFSLMLIVGILVGSYSTIYIASPMVMGWHNVAKKRQRRRDAEKYGSPAARAEAASEGARAAEGAPEPAEAAGGAERPEIPSGDRGVVVRQQPSRKKKRKH